MKWVGCRKAFQEESKMAFKEKSTFRDFPGGPVVGSLPAGAGDTGSSPDLGGSRMPRSN